MVSLSKLSLVFFTALYELATAQFARCNVCTVANRPIAKPSRVIFTERFSTTRDRWTCREIDEYGKNGIFDEVQCRSAVYLVDRFCECSASPVTPSPVISPPICDLCGSEVIRNPNKVVNTIVGSLTCSELITAALDGFFPSVVCPRFNKASIAQECGCTNPTPTRPPTRQPISSPTRQPSITTTIPGIPTVCLSGQNTVLVRNKGILHVKDLKIGDMVSIGNDKFSRVYSFGHRQNHTVADYLQIHVKGTQYPLEITEQHMVFVDQRGAVPASTVMVGDKLVVMSAQNGSSTTAAAAVTHVLHVRRVGAYAPFTESGSLMVSDVLTSSYISMQKHDSQSFSVLAGVVEIASMQWLAHASQAPHRMVCRLNRVFCDTEEYTEDGISHWVYGPFFAADWLMNQNVVVMMFLAPLAFLVLLLFSFAESIFLNMVLLVSVGTLIALKSMETTRKSK